MADDEMRIGTGYARPVQKRKVVSHGWTKARRVRFLKALGETCNVRKAARAAGLESSSHVYTLRRRDPAFAELWAEALANGYDRLETMLLQCALEGLNDIDVGELAAESDRELAAAAETVELAGAAKDDSPDADADTDTVATRSNRPGTEPGTPRHRLAHNDVQLALSLLNRRRDGEQRQRRGKVPMTSDEVDALLLQKIDTLARKLRPAP